MKKLAESRVTGILSLKILAKVRIMGIYLHKKNWQRAQVTGMISYECTEFLEED